MKPALTPTAAEKVTALRTVQFPSISANRWMKIFRSVMGITRHVPPNSWSRKKADEACELVNQFADELVAKIRAHQ